MYTQFWLENLKRNPLGTSRYRWEVNIKIDFRETDCENVNWTELAQDKILWRIL